MTNELTKDRNVETWWVRTEIGGNHYKYHYQLPVFTENFPDGSFLTEAGESLMIANLQALRVPAGPNTWLDLEFGMLGEDYLEFSYTTDYR